MAILVGMLIGALVSLGLGPRTPTLGDCPDRRRRSWPRMCARRWSATAACRSCPSAGSATGQVSFAGLGDEDGAAPTAQTPFELGSITKTFTGLLLADAVERGELALDDQLADHLPELRGTPAGERHAGAVGHPPVRPAGSSRPR